MKNFFCTDGVFGVFGNPIIHSKSPKIHNFFSKLMNINYIYNSYCVPLNNFNYTLKNFFKNNGKGANITIPFKKEAFFFSDLLSVEAKISGVVNTLFKLRNGKIFGDNTDGIGLLYDLKRLNFIKKEYNILIIGSGGAVQGIINSLFSYKCSIYIYNRTYINAYRLVKYFEKIGNIYILNIKDFSKINFNLIIHATSLGIYGKYPELPLSLINENVPCYDLFYKSNYTPFLNWYFKNGGKRISDGFGMLIAQAAYSFKLWYGIKLDIKKCIKILQN